MREVRVSVVFAVFFVALLAMGTASAVNYVDVDATCDVSINYQIATVLNASESTSVNLALPTTLSNINNAGDGNLTIYAGTNDTTVTVVVNGVTVASGYTIVGGTSKSWSLSDFSNSGVSLNTADLSITISVLVNSTSSIWFNASANDAVCSGAYFDVNVTETQTSTPKLEFYDTDSFYTVKQTVNVTQTSDFNITDIKLNFTYPSNAISEDVTSSTISTLNTSESEIVNLYFQKRGPYVTDIDSDAGNETYTTEITIYSPEALTAEIVISPFDHPWYEHFPYFDFSNIKVIELNDDDLSWDTDDDDLDLGTEELDSGENELVISYYKPSGPPVVVPTAIPYEFLGVSLTIWIVIIVAIVVSIIVVVAVRKR